MNNQPLSGLEGLTQEQWEALCDGCARCCLHKLEDEETGEIHYTRIACRLLDLQTCRCTDYANRTRRVPECVALTPQSMANIHWLPPSCAYRLVAEGSPLPPWHPLSCGDREAVHRAGVSVRAFGVPESALQSEEELFDHLLSENI